MLPCRLIVDPPGDGPWNMALDEALLEQAADQGLATLRLYGWAKPTLSLGYFQPYSERESHAASLALKVVRRHSGGGAIVHDQELTYSPALPAARAASRDPHKLYLEVHIAVRETLMSLRSTAGDSQIELCPTSSSTPGKAEPFLCFQRRAAGDLLVSGGPASQKTSDGKHKIGGSSQRKRRGAVLQHGSLLIGQSASAPELPGLVELGWPGLTASRLAGELAPNLGKAMDLEISPWRPDDLLVERAAGFNGSRFAQSEWTRRR